MAMILMRSRSLGPRARLMSSAMFMLWWSMWLDVARVSENRVLRPMKQCDLASKGRCDFHE